MRQLWDLQVCAQLRSSDWQWASAPASPPRSPPLPKPVLVTKKRMLCGAFCAFCACAVQSPSIRNATEAKKDRVFMGDYGARRPLAAIILATLAAWPCTARKVLGYPLRRSLVVPAVAGRRQFQ